MWKFLSSKIIFLVLTVIFFASTWPLFTPKMFSSHDFVHGVRIAEMSRALKDGHFPVRWSNNFGYGYGMPLFEFYAPFPYYIGSFFYLLGVPLIISVKLLFIIPTIGTLLGSYVLGKKLFGRTGGLVTAALITLAPYRALNMFVRGAVSETWGLFAAVCILYATVLCVRGEKKGWVYLVSSLIVLFLSHNLVTLMFVPFAVIFTIVYVAFNVWPVFGSTKNTQTTLRQGFAKLLQIAGGYIVSAGLASFYLLPAILEKNFTIVEQTITGGYFDYSLHFLYIRQLFKPGWGYGGSEWGPNDPISFFLGFGELLGVLIGLLIVGMMIYKQIVQKKRTALSSKMLFLFVSLIILTGLSFLMSLMRSKFIWDAIPAFKFIQFPWRFYSVGVLFLGLLGSFFTVYLAKSKRYIFSAVVILVTIAVNTTYFRPEKYIDNPSGLYYDNPSLVQSHMSGILPDYIPKSLKLPIQPPTEQLSCSDSSACEKTTELIARTQEELFETTVLKPTEVNLAIAEYPGWIVEVDGKQTDHISSEIGTIGVHLEPGYHTVGARFGYTPVRLVADLISIVSLISFLTITLSMKRKNESEQHVS